MSDDEKSHADFWKSISGQAVRPNRWKVLRLRMLTRLLGYTFVLKRIAQDEKLAVSGYDKLVATMPDAARIKQDEERHEQELIQLLNEERLQYVGSMVLGLNDALVELTGTIAGLSFALQNTGMVALSGIITGVSATLSMAASNYLAERADNNPNALKSSIYTGVAYLITVALLVLPYLILPNNLWFLALIMPAFMRPPAEQTGVRRGVATHKTLSLLQWDALRAALAASALPADIARQVAALANRRQLTAEEAALVQPERIAAFFHSPIGRQALAAETVRREWSFNLRLADRGGLIAQGVIDLCFIRDGQWSLVDYKTDRVSTAEELWDAYGEQIALYRRALAEAGGAPVRDATLYSLALGEGSTRE